MMSTDTQLSSLKSLFGSFRAEWLQGQLYELFNEPSYFPTLKDHRPCVLVGGRGTGKTTVLRCMSYEGQYEIVGRDFQKVLQIPFVGLYHRINTTRVTAFEGPNRTDAEWRRLFSHFINIEICDSLLAALEWYKRQSNTTSSVLDRRSCSRLGAQFGASDVDDDYSLRACIDDARDRIEIYINNASLPTPTLSMLQTPIDILVDGLVRTELFHQKRFYIILDEYENFLDYQQRVVNTLIKHSSGSYVFKLGVRELGWRLRSTLNENEQLISPADYDLIEIDKRLQDTFEDFAIRVCETRLSAWTAESGAQSIFLDRLLPDLSAEEEALQLGVIARLEDFDSYLSSSFGHADARLKTSPLARYTFLQLSKNDFSKASHALGLFAEGDRHHLDRYNNYKYAYLFTIAGKGSEFSKYYSGLSIFSKISKNNIRFFLQLVTESINRHLSNVGDIHTPISPVDQTRAARHVGLQYLTELEGVTVRGVQIVKLLLGLGRLFQLYAANPADVAPEYNQFQVKSDRRLPPETLEFAESLLRQGVMHLALARAAGTKLATESDVREWDYAPHPIFAPFFNFSHRRKRKIDLTEQDLTDMVNAPQETIRRLLRDRAALVDQALPQQLKLFDDYFVGNNAPAVKN